MIPAGAIPRELENKVRQELEAGERILWMEQPIPRYFTKVSTGIFLFGIPWTAFSIFWICGAVGFMQPDFSEGGLDLLFPLFGVPFVLIGLCMLFVPLRTFRQAFRTVYVITDRRAITFDSGWIMTIRSYPPEKLQNIFRKEKRDGTGDVVLGQYLCSGQGGRQQSFDYGFLNIRDPKGAEQMLRKLAGQAFASRS